VRLVVCALAALVLATLGIAAWKLLDDGEDDSGRRPGLRFSGSFESGELSAWPAAQCSNTGLASDESVERGTVQVQSDVVGEGDFAARFDLPASPVPQACELLIERSIGVGTDDYYALMLRVPSSWREPSPAGWGLVLAQLNFQGIWGAPVTLSAHADHIALVLQSGPCNGVASDTPGCTNSSGPGGSIDPIRAVPAPLARETWHEVIVHVRWASDDSGRIRVWHRTKGQRRWVKTAALAGYPTLQWTTERGPSALAASTTNDKVGAYRGGADFPVTVWHDGFVRAPTFAAAAAALP
jgi:hypothetical protein